MKRKPSNPDKWSKFRILLNGYIKEKGLTQQDIADAIGISRNSVGAYCAHPETKSLVKISKLATALGIPAEEIRTALVGVLS